ncbi:MAG: molybdate ABC transporter substrate-binding protein [Pseudomonadota bacterium]|nr:molybdate ABC transporter substrate-binding protein [Pseudomonadota bacterium]
MNKLAWILLLLVGLSAAPVMAEQRPPLVLAAASLQESLTAAAKAWASRGHPLPSLSFAASSALARQIEAGAPADLFISADEDWMNDVQAKGRLRAGSRAVLIGNRLVLIAPRSSNTRLAIKPGFALAAALGFGRLAIADPAAVPAGKYGKAALTWLGVWPTVEAKLAPAENVRAALAFVERGEAPLGIVYTTDALASSTVRIVGTFPAASHPSIIYPIALLKVSASREAEGFRRFLLSSAGKAVFHQFGFVTK